jgi:hypothetical protein
MMQYTFSLQPSRLEISYRCLAVRATIIRWHLDFLIKVDPSRRRLRDIIDTLDQLRLWVKNQNVYGHMTKFEKGIYKKKLGEFTHDEISDGLFWNEKYGALLWGASIINTVSCASRYPTQQLVYDVPILKAYSDLITHVKLQSTKALKLEWDTTAGYYCRVAAMIAKRDHQLSDTVYKTTISKCLLTMHDRGVPIDMTIDDLTYGSAPIEQISDRQALALLICYENRLVSIDWLLGIRARWDEPVLGYNSKRKLDLFHQYVD